MVARMKQRGFTMIELVVVTGIMVVITSIMLANNAKFGGVVILRNLVYDMALSMREAQTYGISVRKFGSGAGDFTAGYGLDFQLTNGTSYLLFADVLGENGLYDDAEELVQAYNIGRGFRITDLCASQTGSGAETCGLDRITVVFVRPEPDAHIRVNGLSALYQRARIVVSGPQGDSAAVLVEATGQISIE